MILLFAGKNEEEKHAYWNQGSRGKAHAMRGGGLPVREVAWATSAWWRKSGAHALDRGSQGQRGLHERGLWHAEGAMRGGAQQGMARPGAGNRGRGELVPPQFPRPHPHWLGRGVPIPSRALT